MPITLLQPPAQSHVPADGAIGEAGIDDRHRSAVAFRKSQEVRPEFGLGNNDEPGTKGFHVGPDGEPEVDWEVEDALTAETGPCQFLSCISGGRDNDAVCRPARPHLLDQTANRQDLTDGNRVYPDSWLGRGGNEMTGNDAKTLQKARAIFSMPQHLVKPIRQAQGQGNNEKRTVDDVHGKRHSNRPLYFGDLTPARRFRLKYRSARVLDVVSPGGQLCRLQFAASAICAIRC